MVTIKNHPRKVPFYLPFAIFFSVWFVAEPTYRLLYLYVYPILKSPNIWNGIDLALSFAGHAYFLYLTRPGRLNKRFPFHLRAGKVSFRDIDENVEDLYAPSKDLYSVFQIGKKSDIRNGTTLTILEEPQHFKTPVVPFNAPSEECLAVLPRPSSPEIPIVSATVDLSYRTPSPVIPTVSGTLQKQTPATSSVFVDMPSVVTKQSFKITPAGSPSCKLRKKQIHEEDRAAVEISTASVPNGGFSIFCVQNQPDTGTSPVSDSITTEHKKKSQPDEKDTLTSPKNSVIKVSDDTQENYSLNKEQSSGINSYSFQPRITSAIESTVSFSPKTINGSGSHVQLTNCPLESLQATCKPYQHQEPLKTKAPPVADFNLDMDTDESGYYTRLSHINGITSKVRLINLLPAQDNNLPKMTNDDSASSNMLPEIQSQNNIGMRTPSVRIIQVRPADDSHLQIATTGKSSPCDHALGNESSAKTCNTVSNARSIAVIPVHEPMQTVVNGESAARVQNVLDATKEAVEEIKHVSAEIMVYAPKPSFLATNDMLPIKNLGPLVDPLTWQYPVPPPKFQNWIIEPLEQSKSHLLHNGQGEDSTENLFDLSHGPPTCPHETDIATISEDLTVVPAANGGDFAKPSKKIRKEPSKRRFPKTTDLGMTLDTSSDNQQMAMDLKTKKKKLKRFLKLARRHKNKPAKAD
ncbi:uncharacterized protein LOC135154660 [Lytechinus pictus]|uniref:uncharacterized protein LOC135154660 n=1 Tax=Lytechinus pictus TaxID=7653 RepID=UPI0030BA05B1